MQQRLDELQTNMAKLAQDIKDFRYEPTSLFFRRYHLCIKMARLIKRLLTSLTYLPDISQRLSTEDFQVLIVQQQLSVAISQLTDNIKGKKLLMTLKLLLHYQEKMLNTPRWRLELQ